MHVDNTPAPGIRTLRPRADAARRFALLMALGALAGTSAAQESACGNPFQNHFGPYDYRTVDAQTKGMVERPHFPPGVESLTRPSKTMFSQMAQDVAYTLHVFPNHHRALLTMSRAAKKFGKDPAPGARYTVNCYFERAIQFRPDDTVARALYAQYLTANKREEDALRQLEVATGYAKDNPFSHYNIGLLYFELGKYEQALAQAHLAIALGYTRPELPERLKSVNKWADPADVPPAGTLPERAPAPAASAPSG
jgi:tetratricopeptide (TPR) repeat protein